MSEQISQSEAVKELRDPADYIDTAIKTIRKAYDRDIKNGDKYGAVGEAIKRGVEFVSDVYNRRHTVPERIASTIRERLPEEDARLLNDRFNQEVQNAQEKQNDWTYVGAAGGLVAGLNVWFHTAPYIGNGGFGAGLATFIASTSAGYEADLIQGKAKATKDIKAFCKGELGIDLDNKNSFTI